MNTQADYGPVPIRYSTLPPLPDDYWERRAHHAEEQLQTTHDAIRCACDWLRMQAPGRALEVLEANLR